MNFLLVKFFGITILIGMLLHRFVLSYKGNAGEAADLGVTLNNNTNVDVDFDLTSLVINRDIPIPNQGSF